MKAAFQPKIEHATLSGVARLGVVVMLMISIGAPWAFLQTAAWVSMAVHYSVREGSIVSGLSQTFDGDHPCKLCQAAAKGVTQQQEPEPETNVPTVQKVHLILMVRSITISKPLGIALEIPDERRAVRMTKIPDLPPPKGGAALQHS